jgi:tetratricopeptide (TPR) repeat protein
MTPIEGMTMVEATDLHANRGLRADIPTSYATYVDRWAIVVGVSKYQDGSINLRYADRDAEALYELLKTPSGGGFAEEHICKLVNEEATTANITRALRSFLKKPGKDDIVLLYFACHGAPDTDRPDILYLLTHDTDPKDIAGTALPMREINLSLRENLLAERVIIIADTCHSAGISKGGTRDAGDNSGAINLYLKEVGETQKGIALLTSAEANQVSFEDEKWGGGHGVFTHFLLEGMQGAADRNPKNGIVTVGELFEYVRENVKRATGDTQHPCIGPDSFDRNLPMAITAGISAQEHYELGCQLYQIALKLDDKYCFESVSRHLREAIRQAEMVGRKLPEAQLQLGLVLTASGDLPEAAVTAFKKAIKADVPDADYYLGTAYLNQGEVEAAREHLEAFLSKQPDSDKAGAVQELMSWFDKSNSSHSEAANRYALLIGINYSKLEDPQYRPLKGPVNDIEILNDVLSQKYGFKTTMLSDMEAIYENIVKAFRELQELTKPTDVVIIYFAGYESGDNLVAANTMLNDKGNRLNIISSKELYSLIYAIPSLHKHLILDACISSAFEGFINQINQTKICTLLLSNSLGQLAYEVKIEDTQKTHGYFTYTLVHELEKAPEDILQRTLFEQVKKAVETKYPKQTPFFIGDLDKPLFCADLEYCPDLFTFSQRRCYSSFDDVSLQDLCQKISKQFTTGFPDFYYSLGLAYLEKENNPQALMALKTTIEKAKQKREEQLFHLGIAQFNNGLYSDACQTFQQCLNITNSNICKSLYGNVISSIDTLNKSKRCALLIGINTSYTSYLNGDAVPAIKDSVSDTLTLKNILVSKYGFQVEDVKILNNQDATYQNILKAFNELVDDSRTNSAFFYFAGNGSVDKQGNPTIVAFDSGNQGIPDICLNDLAQLTTHNDINLVSITDSCWTMDRNHFVEYQESNFSASPRKLTIVFDDNAIERDDSMIPKIGGISIYSPSIKYRKCTTLPENLTTLLIQFLEAENSTTATYRKLHQFYKEENRMWDYRSFYGVYFAENAVISDLLIFLPDALKSKIRDSWIKIEQEPTQQGVLILKRLIEQRNGTAPEELFNLGIAHYILQQYSRSITALQAAIDQVSGQNNTTTGEQTTSQRSYPEAHYWLGRVLCESKCDPARAVSELRLATQQSPDNSAAHYYLGKALRALVEQKILTEAERAFQTYLNAGSPLGQQEEVQEFLKSRKETEKN